MHYKLAGYLSETEEGYAFLYDHVYLKGPDAEQVSLTLPLSENPYQSRTMTHKN